MSPEARASLAELARLHGELKADRAAMRSCLAEARDDEARLAESPYRVVAAVALHGWYTGLETLLGRVARVLDRTLPAGETWHRDLLSQAMAEVPSVRPEVLPRSLYSDLVSLLEFRHFFRHAYDVALDPPKVKLNLTRMSAAFPAVDAALDAFEAFLQETMKRLGG
jgi:hypothetical protein